MGSLSRRALLRGSMVLATGATLARPYVARAAGTTLTVWWNQGFYPAEDQAFRTLVAAWEKSSGNTINLTLLPGQALNEKIVSALSSGEVPDLMYADNAPAQIVPQNAWHDKLLDVGDVVATQKSELSATALQSSQFYNFQEKKRAFYGVPFKGATLNLPMWKSLIEKAGYKMSELPTTWDAFFDFFEPVQKKLRSQGMRHAYGLGYTMSTTGDDPNNLFNQFLVAYGGGGIVSAEGHLLGPTQTWFYVSNPAYAQVDAEHVFAVAESDVINGMAPEQATDKAFKRVEDIFSQYQIGHQA